ncbi:MAG TPA: 8-amino-7-oxononanoate synthase [Candidatus Dormibacteraeota bacterium]|nr:8-amino-7-oxononanoate synthase [Candidatus Dormibacteraeota bacterium]
MRDDGAAEDTIERRIAQELDSLRAISQFRTLENSDGIDLSSNDYLGLAYDPRLKHATMEAIANSARVGSTGSRLLSGNAREWHELELEFADFAGTEAALYFGSGYAANLGLLSSLLRAGDFVFSDAMNHASLIDGMRLSGASKVLYPHCDLAFVENALRERAGLPGARVIVTESVFSMEGDVAPLDQLARLANKYDAALVIDEAHATGVCGPAGRGTAAELGIERDVLAIVHTCGKALASAGAFVCGALALKEFLINRARTFIFSTAMPPYMAGQIRAALGLARAADDRRAHSREIAAMLRDSMLAAGINCGASSTHVVPVILGSNNAALRAASELQRAGFAAKAIRPPTVPPGTARIRISLTSRITLEQMHRLAEALRAALAAQPNELSAGPATGAVHV